MNAWEKQQNFCILRYNLGFCKWCIHCWVASMLSQHISVNSMFSLQIMSISQIRIGLIQLQWSLCDKEKLTWIMSTELLTTEGISPALQRWPWWPLLPLSSQLQRQVWGSCPWVVPRFLCNWAGLCATAARLDGGFRPQIIGQFGWCGSN